MSAGMVCVPVIVPLKDPRDGKKANIDTNTMIELSTETRNAYLYYTIDGTKPEPFKKYGERTTRKYTKPFHLPSGKITIKALAVADDKIRESSVNTKVFQVEQSERAQSEISHIDLTEDDNRYFRDEKSPRNGWTTPKTNGRQRSPSPRSSRLVTKVLNGEMHSQSPPHTRSLLFQSPHSTHNSFDMSQSPQKCIYCNAQRPSDPYARFCNECGKSIPPVPQGRQSFGSDSKNTRVCKHCHSVIPYNDVVCQICNLDAHRDTLSTTIMLCPVCGSTNSTQNVECVVCDAPLTQNQKAIESNKNLLENPPPPDNSAYVICSRCSRANCSNARFCDWCGSKPSPSTSAVSCHFCKYPNHSYARYCSSCRQLLHPPLRIDFDYDSMGRRGLGLTQQSQNDIQNQHNSPPRWMNVVQTDNNSVYRSVATQTAGSFYPPSQTSTFQRNGNFGPLSPGRQSSLSANGSPGKGYWRQQVDYVAKHLKVYSQSDLEFREAFSEVKLGNLLKISALPSDDLEEFNLEMSFALLDDKKSFKSKAQSVKTGMTLIKALTNAQKLQVQKMEKEIRIEVERQNKKIKVNRPKSSKKSRQISEPNKKLIKFVTENYDEDENEEVKNNFEVLLDDGADIDVVNEDGDTPLKLAIQNVNHYVVSLLIKAHVDVNKQSGAKETTPLHTAVNMGNKGAEFVSILLKNSADGNLKNKAGETPYDLALKLGYNEVLAKFTSNYGMDLLKSVIK